MKMTVNGKHITSAGQLSRELEKSLRQAVDRQIKAAAPPGVTVRKTSRGYIAEGTPDAIERMVKRFEK